MELDTKNEAQEPAQNGHQPHARLTPELAPASAASESGGVAVTSQRPVHLPGEMLPVERTVVRGSSLGATYVRARPPVVRQFRPRGQDVVEATELTLMPQSRAGRVGERVKRFLIGSRLPTAAAINERLTKVKALAVLSSDAISSVAYATEASLGILVAAGAGALQMNVGIALAIALLMMIVGTSYFQTIHAYPNGGGSYIVAHDNLGELPGLIAAAALLIDYVLTVSVSVSSGIDAFVSAVTPLARYDVPLGVLAIVIILVVNLRGVRESGSIFAAPTYLFIFAFLLMIGAGIFYAATHGGGLLGAVHPGTIPVSRGWGDLHERLGLLLILTAFASGCSAMTGVEAISNGIPAFKPPESRNAGRTLIWMVGILVTLFLGVTYLAWRFGIVPYANQQPTVDAQIADLIFNKGYSAFGFMYYVVQFATLLILVLAANTSFADFPRLSSILARDTYLPHLFALRGDRLAFSTGIVVLGVLSTILLVAFKGSTDALINLYALGVFTAFTLSQSGMVVHWWRKRDAAGPGWRRSMIINGAGAFATGIVTLVIGISKFDRGAWIVVLLVPVLVLMFKRIHSHYESVGRQVSGLEVKPVDQIETIALVPISQLDRVALRSLVYAQTISPHVVALHVTTDANDEKEVRERWAVWLQKVSTNGKPLAAGSPPSLVVIESPYRSLIAPLLSYVDATRDANPSAIVTVILPEFVPAHWWERILHNQTAFRLKLALYSHRGVVVANVPYHLAG